MFAQLNKYLIANDLREAFQSAYKVYHRPEMALLRVHAVLAPWIRNNSVMLGFPDLSAAFDTVSHEILISRLATRFRTPISPIET